MAQKVDNITVHDSLAPVAEFIKIGNPDFDLYRQQKAKKLLGWHDEEVTKETKEAAWNLDKYKNLHVVHMAYNLMPKKKWYLHIDADTYLFWPSLLHWLPTLDTSGPVYTGSLTCFQDVKAAHGGSGILLSDKAMRAIVVDNSSTVPSWDAQAQKHCCGDELVARALIENGIEMHNSWPIINGENPATVPFGSQYWCEPIVTLHHMTVEDMLMVAKFEAQRKTPNVCLMLEAWSIAAIANILSRIRSCTKSCSKILSTNAYQIHRSTIGTTGLMASPCQIVHPSKSASKTAKRIVAAFRLHSMERTAL
jgi:hypothetical protein